MPTGPGEGGPVGPVTSAEVRAATRGSQGPNAVTAPATEDSTDADGVDVTLIRWCLTLTPSQRLDVLQGFVDSAFELRRGRSA